MIIFLLALLVLIGALLVNFLPSLKTNRVLIMSVLAILMIMINFINEIDIIVSPPQLLVKVDSRIQGKGKKYFSKLPFKQDFPTQKMKYFSKVLADLKLSVSNSFQKSGSLNQEQRKSMLEQLQNFPPKLYVKPLIKEQSVLIEQLKNRLVNDQDSVIYFKGINKARFQLLIQFFITEVNQKAQIYGHKFQKVRLIQLYSNQMNDTNIKGYKFGEKLSENHYHYLVIFDSPSQKLLQFLYEQYRQAAAHLTVIFLQIHEKINIFPISKLIEQISIDQMTYIQPINELIISKTQTLESKQSKQLIKKSQSELENCERYLEMSFEFLLRLLAFGNHQTISKICYEKLFEPISEEIQCIRSMIEKQDDQISLYKAKRCWKGKKQPEELIFSEKGKHVKLKKQHYWHQKVNATDFGLEIVSKQCSNEL